MNAAIIIHRVRQAAEWGALGGGVLLLVAVLLTAVSAMGNILFSKPVPGDFEFVKITVAVSVFSFLPYCQLTGANVCADIFTSRLSPRVLAWLSLFASLIAATFSVVLLWRMTLGMLDYRSDGEVTYITGFPVWMAFPPILLSLLLLILATAVTAVEAAGRCFDKSRLGSEDNIPLQN